MANLIHRLDANESAFFQRQLEYIEPTVYRVEYPELKARRFFPVSNEAGAGVQSITYRQYDRFGKAAIIGAKAKDLPRVDVVGAEFTQRVKHLGDAYGYDYFEIKEAARAGINLDSERAMAARQGIETSIDEIAFFGDDEHDLPGLLNNGNITREDVAADGTGSSTKFVDKTPDKILRDMNNLAKKVVEGTNGVEAPDTLVLPIDQYTHIATTPRSDTSDTTILAYFLANSPFIRNVDSSYRLKGAGTGGVDVMVAYRRNPGVLKLHVPVEFTQLPLEIRGMEYLVNCVADIAGLLVYKPKAIRIGEGI